MCNPSAVGYLTHGLSSHRQLACNIILGFVKVVACGKFLEQLQCGTCLLQCPSETDVVASKCASKMSRCLYAKNEYEDMILLI